MALNCLNMAAAPAPCPQLLSPAHHGPSPPTMPPSLPQVHHICLLLGYGVDAICPYLAFETLAALQVRCRGPGPAAS